VKKLVNTSTVFNRRLEILVRYTHEILNLGSDEESGSCSVEASLR
jgi:hypothetical protein